MLQSVRCKPGTIQRFVQFFKKSISDKEIKVLFLNCFMVCIIESYRSLFEECESTSSSSYSTPSSSRTNSSKLKSPSFTQQQQQQQQQQLQQQQPVHHQRNHSFEKMPLRSKESSSFKDKLKQKLSRSFSTS